MVCAGCLDGFELETPGGAPFRAGPGGCTRRSRVQATGGVTLQRPRVRWEVTEGPIPQISAGTEEVGLGSVVGLYLDTRARKQLFFFVFSLENKIIPPRSFRLPPFTPMAGYACAVVCGITPPLGGSANCPAEPGGEFRAGQVTDSPRSERGERARCPPFGMLGKNSTTSQPTNQPYSNI